MTATPAINTAALRALIHGESCDSWARVEREWPEEIPLTEAAFARARELGLDLECLGKHLPQPARAEYERACATAWSDYDRVCDAAWAEYERAVAPAQAEYRRTTAPARAEYDRVRDATLLAALASLANDHNEDYR